jgi:hypothetical protein
LLKRRFELCVANLLFVYEYYDSLALLKIKLKAEREQIQCVVCDALTPDSVAFGQTQHPQMWDYADGVDTLQFLLSL